MTDFWPFSIDIFVFVDTVSKNLAKRKVPGNACNCIVTRGGVYDEILPEPEGFPEGSGNISLYTPTRVTIQSFSIT